MKRTFILDNLSDISVILNHLIQEGIFTVSEVEEVNIIDLSRRKIAKIIEKLREKPYSDFLQFIQILGISNNGHVAKSLVANNNSSNSS